MTGIAGFLSWKQDVREQKETLAAMTHALAHRRIGTQQTVEHVQDSLALTSGLIWSANDVTVAVEGYLYNHHEILRELLQAGHHLQEDNLAALIQGAYLHWGDSFVERLYGAFAFVLWDAREYRLLLGRDHLGVKPLYYADCDGVIAFGSEIKAVLEHPLVTREIDAVGLSEMLVKGPYFTPGHALFRDVQEVLPGHIVICTPDGRKSVCYWELKSYEHEDSLEETAANLYQLVESNIVQLKQAGLAQTAILSGGLDSSALIALMCKAGRTDYKTYSGNTPESLEGNPEERDAFWVKRVAEHLGITNEEVMSELSAMLEFNHAPRRAQDMPVLAQYDSLVYVVFKKIRERQEHSIMVGEAADEIFGSLPWFYNQNNLDAQMFPWQDQNRSIFASDDLLQTIRAEEYVQDLYHDYLRKVPRLPGESPEKARFREFSYLTIKDYMATILRKNDRMGMSLNMEIFIPFCDPRFAQYVWNIPWEMKNHGDQKKGVLREAFRPILPDDVVYRKKALAPIVLNDSYADYVYAEYDRLLQDPQAPIYAMLNRDQVRKVLEEKTIYQDRSLRWRLDYYLQIDHWLRENKVVLR